MPASQTPSEATPQIGEHLLLRLTSLVTVSVGPHAMRARRPLTPAKTRFVCVDSGLPRRPALRWYVPRNWWQCEPLARSSRSLPRNCCLFKMECCLQPRHGRPGAMRSSWIG